MRLIYGWCAAAFYAVAASAQAPVQARQTLAPLPAGAAIARPLVFDSLRLSRREVILEALRRNAALQIADEQIAQARARKVSGTSVPDPVATAGYDGLSSPFRFGGAPAKPAAFALNIPFPDKFRLNSRIGAADVHASESNFRLQAQSVVLQASAGYDSLLSAQMHRDNLIESRNLAADFLKRTEFRYNAGTAAKLDVIQAQVAVAQADNDLIANERDIANANALLNRILGRTTAASIAPSDSLGMPNDLPDSSDIERLALASRPELAIVQQQRTGARFSTRIAKEFWLPDLAFAVQRDYVVPGAASFTTGVAFPLPIFYWQHAKGDIAQAQHYERELAATERDTRAIIVQDVRTTFANASTAVRQVVFLRDQLLPAATEAYRIASTSYSLGGSSALEVLNARSSLLAAQSQYIDALANANTARADFERAVGTPVTTSGAPSR